LICSGDTKEREATLSMIDEGITVAGIDVGGNLKGNHLVVLKGKQIIVHPQKKLSPVAMLDFCKAHDVTAVGIDAPCRWATDGAGRSAERMLAQNKISCFWTPTREKAVTHPKKFYQWMFNGEDLFKTFSTDYPLLTSAAYASGTPSFETFPYAITCAILGKENTFARLKDVQRREVLNHFNIDYPALFTIDQVDATLCAITANLLMSGKTEAFGDASGGFIHFPRRGERSAA